MMFNPDIYLLFIELNAIECDVMFLDCSENLIKRLSIVCTEQLRELYNFGVDYMPDSWINEYLHNELKNRGVIL